MPAIKTSVNTLTGDQTRRNFPKICLTLQAGAMRPNNPYFCAITTSAINQAANKINEAASATLCQRLGAGRKAAGEEDAVIFFAGPIFPLFAFERAFNGSSVTLSESMKFSARSLCLCLRDNFEIAHQCRVEIKHVFKILACVLFRFSHLPNFDEIKNNVANVAGIVNSPTIEHCLGH